MQKMQGMWVLSLGQEESLEKEMATCSSVLAYKIPLDRERCLVGYNPWGCKESDVTEHTHTPMPDISKSSIIVNLFITIIVRCFFSGISLFLYSHLMKISNLLILQYGGFSKTKKRIARAVVLEVVEWWWV